MSAGSEATEVRHVEPRDAPKSTDNDSSPDHDKQTGTKDTQVARDGGLTDQAAQATPQPLLADRREVPTLWRQERLGLGQIVALCLGFGLYTSRGQLPGLNGEGTASMEESWAKWTSPGLMDSMEKSWAQLDLEKSWAEWKSRGLTESWARLDLEKSWVEWKSQGFPKEWAQLDLKKSWAEMDLEKSWAELKRQGFSKEWAQQDWGLEKSWAEWRRVQLDLKKSWAEWKSHGLPKSWAQLDLEKSWGQWKSRLSAEIMGSQLDLVELATWLRSRTGDNIPPKWASAMPEPPGLMTLIAIALVLWGFGEATAFPRHDSMQTAWDCARILMQLVGDLALLPLFLLLPGELTEVFYTPTPQNERILASCPSMWRFKQTPWFRNQLVSFAGLMYYDFRNSDQSVVHRETLRAPDGGTIALDWYGSSMPGTNGKSKVLFVASTWAGDALVTALLEVCKHFTAEGWQCVVMVKRGCGVTMPNKQFPLEGNTHVAPWCLSGFEDFQLAVDHVVNMCQGVPVCGYGPSLGAGQLRNYCRVTGTQCKLAAAVVVDAGEDWNLTVPSLDRRVPCISAALRMAGNASFDLCGVPQKVGMQPEESASDDFTLLPRIYAGLSQIRSFAARLRDPQELEGPLFQWVRDRQAPALGFEASAAGVGQYLRRCQPADPSGCKVPTLEILTFNDFLVDASDIRNLQQMYLASPHIVTCTTRMGTHVVRWTGWRCSCWISPVACDFLESAMRELAEARDTSSNMAQM